MSSSSRSLTHSLSFRTRQFLFSSGWLKLPLGFRPVSGVAAVPSEAGNWCSTDSDPFFIVEHGELALPPGWYRLDLEISGQNLAPKIYASIGNGFDEDLAFPLSTPIGGKSHAFFRVPAQIHAFRFDPMDEPGRFRLGAATLVRQSRLDALWRAVGPVAKAVVRQPALLPKKAATLWQTWKYGGFAAVRAKVRKKLDPAQTAASRSYASWVATYDRPDASRLAAARAEAEGWSGAQRPLISILVPVYNPPEELLRKCLDSVLAQAYPHWELCLADDCSPAPHVRTVLAEYAQRDPRIRVVHRERNGHIVAASNSALAIARGDYLALLDHDDELAPLALYWVARTLHEHPDAALLYSDEDKIDEYGVRRDPYFKPGWNPELILGQNFISHLGVYRTDVVRQLDGFRPGLEGSQDWDLALRVIDSIKPEQIVHIPRVLYHWRIHAESTAASADAKPYAALAGKRAIADHLERNGWRGELLPAAAGAFWRVKFPIPQPAPKVAIIIPTRNRVELLRSCVETVRRETSYPNFELVIIDNQSDDPATLTFLKELASHPNVRVLRYDAPFNYSSINNFAVRQVDAEYLALLNNDIEVISRDWLAEMVSHAARPGVGAVGAMLYYPDNTIQHAGVLVGFNGVAGHTGSRQPRGFHGQMGRLLLTQSLGAVSAACLVIKKSIFDEVGGLDEANLAVAFNDVDFCLKVAAAGYRNVWTPFAELYHHESASRGYEDTPEKKARFDREVTFMKTKWGKTLERDPAYNPNLSLYGEPFTFAFPPRLPEYASADSQ